jgi:hypothetical protein
MSVPIEGHPDLEELDRFGPSYAAEYWKIRVERAEHLLAQAIERRLLWGSDE